MKREIYLIVGILIMTLSVVSAQEYSIDISGLKSEEYSLGEEIIFNVILLEGTTTLDEEIDYKISDALNKKEITGQANSNSDISVEMGEDFVSGLWTITATYLDSKVERTFLIGEKSEVEFIIEGDDLIIRNKGNVRYTKTIHITIGAETNSYAQNIRVGEEKVLKLISPEGRYDIQVSDDSGASIKRENVQLFGTGNVIGAVDKELVGYTGFVGADDPKNRDERFIALTKLPLALIFVAAVGILAALVFVERKMVKKKKS